jgi:hypothetical protein
MKKLLFILFLMCIPVLAQEQDPTKITGNIIGVPKPTSDSGYLVGMLRDNQYYAVSKTAFLDSIFSVAFTITPIVTFTAVPVLSAGFTSTAQTVYPTNAVVADTNVISAGVTSVNVGDLTYDADDFIVLPAIASVPVGHRITIVANGDGNFELRTPAASAEEINSEDCDGTKEYLVTDGNIVTVVKISDTIDWVAYEHTPLGAVVTAVVPD